MNETHSQPYLNLNSEVNARLNKEINKRKKTNVTVGMTFHTNNYLKKF